MPLIAHPTTLGIDIGGANLKLATANGFSLSTFFPMWTDHGRLAERLGELLRQFHRRAPANYQQLAVTMTGEMADCFVSRSAGVRAILEQVSAAAPDLRVSVYTVDGTWLSPTAAAQDPWRVASSNWHALASWLVRAPVGRSLGGQLVVDIGSTTVDVIPVNAQGVTTAARTDSARMLQQQLVYTGISRTPIAAILSHAVINGVVYPLVAERFATSDDAYVVLGLISPTQPVADCEADVPAVWDTADGRSRSLPHARARLARMLGEDSERLLAGEIESLAQQVIAAQANKVAAAIRHNLITAGTTARPTILFSGHGRSLAIQVQELLQPPVDCHYLDDLISPAAARCAPAVAVAWLLENREA